jgi:hypothetical protein
MTTIRHCRHCMGNCMGECLVDDTGRCLHSSRIPGGLPWRMRAQLVLSRRWWRRVFRGVR